GRPERHRAGRVGDLRRHAERDQGGEGEERSAPRHRIYGAGRSRGDEEQEIVGNRWVDGGPRVFDSRFSLPLYLIGSASHQFRHSSMFESLSDKLQNVFKRLRGKGSLTEADVSEALREVRLALLEADVNFRVVKDFIARVKERAVGQDVLES